MLQIEFRRLSLLPNKPVKINELPPSTACDTQDLTLHDYFLEKRNLKNVFPPTPANRKSFVTRVLNVTYFEGLCFLK